MTPPTYLESLTNYFRGWRYPFFGTIFLYLLMVLGWVGLGGGLADLGSASLLHVGLGALAATLLLFGIFLLNDAADRHVDARVHPDRPIPKGLSQWKHVAATAVGLMLAACVVSFFVNPVSLAVAAAMTAYALLFYGWAKGGLNVPGSSEVLTPVVSALFPLYALSVAGCQDARIYAGVVGYIYLADFSQDLLGGIHDQAGDRVGNVRTFALAIGPSRTLIVSVVCFVLATAAGASLFVGGHLGVVYALVLAGVTVTMLAFYTRLFRAAHGRDAQDPALLMAADRANHLAGMFFFIVSAATFVDHVARRLLDR
jgi:4-hydroxybenzoate polyprenyltransferase